MASIGDLPDEVQLIILSHLQSDPPSITEVRRQIYADTFTRSEQPLKSLSSTSRRWRRLIQPELHKHVMLDLGALLKPAGRVTCDSCDCMTVAPINCDYGKDIAEVPQKVEAWCKSVSSLLTPQTMPSVLVVCKEPIACQFNKAGLELAIHSMWDSIFQTLNPKRVVIQARHLDLLLLLGGGACPDYNTKVTEQHEFRVLELDCKLKLDEYKFSDHVAADYGLASKAHGLKATMLHARPWAHIGLNEGIGMVSNTPFAGMLPRDSNRSLVDRLFPPCCVQQEVQHSHRWQHLRDEMSFLDCFSLTAPHAHANYVPSLRDIGGVHQFQFVRELRLSLLPQTIDVDIYDLPSDEQVDWWHGRIYDSLRHYCQLRVDMLAQFKRPYWRLRKVICHDDEVLQRYPVFMRYFKERVTEMLRNDVSDQQVEWNRVWEVLPDQHTGELHFTAHA